MAHIISRCDQCGQHDDHPKVHVGNAPDGASCFHHDCLSADLRAELLGHDKAAQIIAAAEAGIHGDDLRAHIVALHQEG